MTTLAPGNAKRAEEEARRTLAIWRLYEVAKLLELAVSEVRRKVVIVGPDGVERIYDDHQQALAALETHVIFDDL